ncbi:MAG: DUF4097 domain-containing protein [Lachnoclostridium sp.]|jgi:hypothetical protein|nr:DUF4097 domain-containing protein [Lachnoclostridium sp.]
MKKSYRITLCLAGSLIFIGVIIAIAAGILIVKNGGDISESYGFFVQNIFREYEREENDMERTNQTIDLETGEIKRIVLTANYGKVEFVKGDRFSYQVIGTDVNSSMFTHGVDQDTWRINIKNRSGFYFFGFGKDDHISKLIITVPSTEVLEEVTLNMNAGTVEVERLAAKKLKMEMGAGSLNAEELVGEDSLTLSVSAGKCKVEHMIGANPNIRCEAGQIDANGVLTGTGKIKCGVGQIDIDLVGDMKDYDYDVTCSIGTIRVNGNQVGGFATNSHKSTNAANMFDLDCAVGQIDLRIDQ